MKPIPILLSSLPPAPPAPSDRGEVRPGFEISPPGGGTGEKRRRGTGMSCPGPAAWGRGALALAALLPALCWYRHAYDLLGEGSRASADNAAIWLGTLVPTALLLTRAEHAEPHSAPRQA